MRRKPFIFSLSMALAVSMMLPAPMQAAKVLKLSKKSVSLCIGDSTKMQMKNTKKSVTWKSNNKKIAAVTQKGKIKAKKSGSTKIVAKIGKKKYKCKVTVKKQKLNKTSIDLLVGENAKLKASGISKKANINWVSTNNEVATVYDGKVVATGEGTATIKAVIPEVFGKTLKCKVTVTVTENEKNEPGTDNSVENNTPNNNMQEPIDNNAEKDQNKEENKNNSSSTNTPYISISSGGSSSGTNSSSNSSGSGSSTTVVTNTNAISITEKEVISFGSTKTYDISISGNTDIGTVTWSSSNEKILTVDQNGKAYGVCPGTATLKVTTSKGLTASINIDVVKTEGLMSLTVEEKYNIKDKLLKNINTDKLQWKSENETIASVDKDGIVTGLKEGTIKIIGIIDNIACMEIEFYIMPKPIIVNPDPISPDPANPDLPTEGDVEAELIYNTQGTVVIGCTNKGTATKITIPDGVTTIGVNAFSNMYEVKTVTMPDSVTEIDNAAFVNCGNLENITLSKNIRRIGESTFSGCSKIENIELPNTLEEMGGLCFCDCDGITSIAIPDKIKNIPESSFLHCDNLESIKLPENVVRIEYSAFSDCLKLKNIDISNVKYIGSSAFSNCISLEKIEIPDTITSTYTVDEYDWEHIESNIENDVFYGCSNLKEVTLSNNMEYISALLFANCSALTEIVLPENTKKIGESAFQSCASLEKVTIPETVMEINDTVFQYCYSLSVVRGKAGSYAEIWADKKGYVFEAITE